MSVISNEFTPVSPATVPEGDLPAGVLFTKHVTQQHLKECERALSRPLFEHEVRILDDIMHALYVRAKFAKGEQEIRDGKGIPHDEAKRRLSKWVK